MKAHLVPLYQKERGSVVILNMVYIAVPPADMTLIHDMSFARIVILICRYERR